MSEEPETETPAAEAPAAETPATPAAEAPAQAPATEVGEERRQSYRLNKVLGAEIEHEEMKFQARLFIIDISATGFRATNQHQLPTLVDLRVKIILHANTPPLDSAARIVWSKEMPMSGLFQFGFEFINLADEERARLEAFIESEKTASKKPTETLDLGRPWTTIRP